MNTAQRFRCRDCETERVIPESPTTGPKRVRIGCQNCKAITSHQAVGRV